MTALISAVGAFSAFFLAPLLRLVRADLRRREGSETAPTLDERGMTLESTPDEQGYSVMSTPGGLAALEVAAVNETIRLRVAVGEPLDDEGERAVRTLVRDDLAGIVSGWLDAAVLRGVAERSIECDPFDDISAIFGVRG